MFTQNLCGHKGGVWLCGATSTEASTTSFDGDELISLFNNQDCIYADLELYDEGEYTFTADFNNHYDTEVFIGFWYMDNGSFEPQLKKIARLYSGEPVTFIYKKQSSNRYYGSLILFCQVESFDTQNVIEQLFENASLDISFKSYPKSVINPIVLINDNITKRIYRHRIDGIILRGVKLDDGSIICDKLELKSGQLIRFISPCIDTTLSINSFRDYILPIANTEQIDTNLLQKLSGNCTISSNIEIKLFPDT